MIVNGREIAEEIKKELREKIVELSAASKPRLALVIVGENPTIERFVSAKKKFAADIGVSVSEIRLPSAVSTESAILAVQRVAETAEGIVVQLPLPLSLNAEAVLNAIPAEADVDALSQESARQFEIKSSVMPPVIGAIQEVLIRHSIFLGGKKVLVVGQGKLVGQPAAIWFKRQGTAVTVCDMGDDLSALAQDADIIVLGAGVPGLLRPEMIKQGVIILDAGTSEEGGKVVGDADPACAEKAALFTPTPGGIGPITVAMLFKNLVDLGM